MTELPADVRNGCRRAQLIGAALVLSVAAYAYVLRLVAAQHAPFIGFVPSIDLRLLRVLFALLAVAELAMLRFVTPRTLTVAHAARGSAMTQVLLSLSIVRLAICEAVAVLGVVLFLLGGHWADFSGFACVSLAAFAFNFPRLSQWEERATSQFSRPA